MGASKMVRHPTHPTESLRVRLEFSYPEIRELAAAVVYYHQDVRSVPGHQSTTKPLERSLEKLNNALRSWGCPEVSLDDA